VASRASARATTLVASLVLPSRRQDDCDGADCFVGGAYQAPALILLVSPSQRQSAELFRSLMLLYGKLKGAPELNAESVLKAEFANGSRILALPGTEKTIRGYAKADLVVIDEAARCDDELPAAVRPPIHRRRGLRSSVL
jgi:hypothetical protein